MSCAEKYKIFIPNVFSPNGDGRNEKFQLQGAAGIVEQVLLYQIFDRWGELLYERQNFLFEDPSFWWDGYFNGKKALPGVYVFQINLKFQNELFVLLKGMLH